MSISVSGSPCGYGSVEHARRLTHWLRHGDSSSFLPEFPGFLAASGVILEIRLNPLRIFLGYMCVSAFLYFFHRPVLEVLRWQEMGYYFGIR